MHEEDRIEASALDAWEPMEPPAGFADRVMAAREAGAAVGSGPASEESPAARPKTRAPGRGRLLRAFAAGAAIAASIAIATLELFAPAPLRVASEGRAAPSAQAEVRIGGRAVAVVEAGASIAWKVGAGGATRVEQARGDVFYRVEKGGPFVVTTAAGDVSVQGTCFRVEVETMGWSKMTAAAAAGAVAATIVTVAVYEGRVRVANAQGEASVGAGESATLAAGAAPSVIAGDRRAAREPVDKAGAPPALVAALMEPPGAAATREDLLARDEAHRGRIALLESRVKKLEEAAAEKPDGRRGGPGGEKKFYDLTPQDWAEMAKDCELRMGLPNFGNELHTFQPSDLGEMGIAEALTDDVNRVYKAQNDAYMGKLRALYLEATGDAAGADTLDMRSLATEILEKSGKTSASDARRRIALEHAGQAPTADPSTLSVAERYYRMTLAAGEDFEKALGEVVGPDVAHRTRDAWTGNRSTMSGCAGRK